MVRESWPPICHRTIKHKCVVGFGTSQVAKINPSGIRALQVWEVHVLQQLPMLHGNCCCVWDGDSANPGNVGAKVNYMYPGCRLCD
eukprot:CAMPEP_0172791002 /NCGR_PEP_ID=MMETSP1074-20121228/208252_1 /TAXON_ID=2916 /ORGANISM="Ceratium fusus, Strain PA161109" /LENGTH=85 /DNA_ID=CAMNT_0013628057 /DNA_START=464 /DNA_END=721 /DNA_ORIENTATION=+